jgi:hypothetical protein
MSALANADVWRKGSYSHVGKESVRFGEGVTLNVDPWKGAAIQPSHRDVSISRKDTRLLIGHPTMLASQEPDDGSASASAADRAREGQP